MTRNEGLALFSPEQHGNDRSLFDHLSPHIKSQLDPTIYEAPKIYLLDFPKKK